MTNHLVEDALERVAIAERMAAEITRLREINAELLEAAKAIISMITVWGPPVDIEPSPESFYDVAEKLEAAIERADKEDHYPDV